MRSSHPPGEAARRRFADNPFFILAVPANATLAEIRHAAARWLDALQRGDAVAATYATPVGPQPRTAERVRHAVTRLRDRDERVQYELWASVGPHEVPAPSHEDAPGWPGAPDAFGWGPR